MSVANCPSCGASVEFAIGSSNAVVCGYCNSIVARSDRGIESHGKAADLIDTGSVLRRGLHGAHRQQKFRITGRTQLRHAAGGVWDEWYAAFDDGRWGWLAEAQGRFYITFRVTGDAPPQEHLQIATQVPQVDNLTVAEIGEAQVISAEGELPWAPVPGSSYAYADLSGTGRRFATIDYSEEPPAIFKGFEASLSELGLEEVSARAGRVSAKALNCSQCGAPLELRAPEAERIFCPSCGAGHDVSAGKLEFFQTLKKKRVKPVLPLGKSGTVEGTSYVIAGFMERSVKFDRYYYWTEYLLWEREKGYRWLVHSDDHWSFVTPLRPGEVEDSGATGVAKSVSYEGKRFRLFQEATARVSYVLGEFYWKVEVGEEVDTADYVAPPFGISKEMTRRGAREVSYSHARYMQPEEVETAFGVTGLPRPTGVGPMQPYSGANLGRIWAAFALLLILLAAVIAFTRPSGVLLDRTWDMATVAETPEAGRTVFTDPFPISGKSNVLITARADVDNSWAYVAGDLVNTATNKFDAFDLNLEYFHGVDGGERWSEGKKARKVFLARPEAGSYALRLHTEWQDGTRAPTVHVTVREGVFRWTYFFVAFVIISIFPLLAIFQRLKFEGMRWKESSHSPFGAIESSDDEEEE